MNKTSNIFDRILFIIEKKDLKNVAALAEILGYGSPQKIYRLKQEKDSKPSYDIIKDFSHKFDDLNLRWFITGLGEPFVTTQKNISLVSEPGVSYGSDQIEKLKEKITELEIEKKSLLMALREIGAGQSLDKKSPKNPKKQNTKN